MMDYVKSVTQEKMEMWMYNALAPTWCMILLFADVSS